MLTPRLWWLWVGVEIGRGCIWLIDTASAADGAMVSAYDTLMDRP